MKHFIKKAICILLLFAMLLTMVPVAFANNETESEVDSPLSQEKPAVKTVDPDTFLARISEMKIPASEQVKPQTEGPILAEGGAYSGISCSTYALGSYG